MNSFVAVALAICCATSVQASDKLTDRVDEFIRAEMLRQKVPGVAMAIVKKDELMVDKGYGQANIELGVPVKNETIFQSGSLGKQFTATAVMLQVEDGKLALDDPITRYLPGAPERWMAIKVRHLLTHTSGIPDYTEKELDYQRNYTEDELAQIAFRLKLEFEPGSRWSYSNTGYVLLGIYGPRSFLVQFGLAPDNQVSVSNDRSK